MFAGPSPAPAKHALWRLGRIRDELRLPLVPVAAPVAARVEAVLADLGVLAAGAA